MNNSKMNTLSAIPNNSHIKFIESLNTSKFLYDKSIPELFKLNFVKWIKQSTLNKITGLEEYTHVSLTNGSIQIFDHFYLKHFNKRFRFFKDEFMYHNAVCKLGLNYEFIENDYINPYDTFIVSVPFTRKGTVHHDMLNILDKCEELQVPVLLDFCHYTVSKDTFIDLNKYKCIETLSFSLSKFFWGAEFLRIGIRLQKQNIDDGVDVFNSSGIEMYSRINIGIANEIINNFHIDYNWNTYSNIYSDVCAELDITESNNILMGFTKEEIPKRICIPQSIGDKYVS
jgi:hypothetical protein